MTAFLQLSTEIGVHQRHFGRSQNGSKPEGEGTLHLLGMFEESSQVIISSDKIGGYRDGTQQLKAGGGPIISFGQDYGQAEMRRRRGWVQ